MHGSTFGYSALCETDNNDVAQIFEMWQNSLHFLPDGSMDEHYSRPTIVEHIDIVVGTERGIHRHGNRPNFDSSKKGGGKLWRVEQQEGAALFQSDADIEH